MRALMMLFALTAAGAWAQAPVITITPPNPGPNDQIFIDITETPPNCPGLFAGSSSSNPPFPTDRIEFRGPSVFDRAGTIYSCTVRWPLYFPQNGSLPPGVYPVTYSSGFSTTIFVTVSAVSGGVTGQAPTLSAWMMFLLMVLIALIARRAWINGRMGVVSAVDGVNLIGRVNDQVVNAASTARKRHPQSFWELDHE